ncbi:hypothetical protein ACLOAU_03810 [Niabella sp. CJ426]|uniref:hypothetical protein n=1 Tax=Niabella sp. CJ426 TaxID=3393740 RepID=UPI003D05A541
MKQNSFLVILAFCICLISFFAYTKIKKGEIRAIEIQNDSISDLQNDIGYLERNISFSNKYAGFTIKDSSFIKCKEMNNEDSSIFVNLIAPIKSNKHSLFLRYTEIGCNMCNDMVVAKLRDFNKNNPDTKIYSFVDFSLLQSYLQWRKGAKMNFEIFYKKKGDLPMDIDSPQYSYLFLLSKSGTIRKIFVPDSRFPNLFDNFLSSISHED